MALARLSVQEKATRGEIVPVRLVILHAMESGFRLDANGQTIAKNVIRAITCRYAAREVWRAELSSGIAANPYFEFFVRADVSGDIEVVWEDDNKEKGSIRQRIEVAT
ncbi:MAG: thiosulfate oxidation carrier complex protein SoxZ [Betaproteobacteria bacterium]|nr:thiosulfate oxidation carrier complex protein SoxZ [Betaproteobacteria bacterium]